MLKLNNKKSKRSGKKAGRAIRSKKFLLAKRRFSPAQLIIVAIVLAAIGGTLIHFGLAATANPSIYYNYDSVIQFNDVNQTRQSAGKNTVTESTCLDKEAEAWAAHMASTGVLAHPADFGSDVNAYCDGDWTSIAQNVGAGGCAGTLPDTCSQQIYNAFLASPEHHGNIVGNYVKLGVGTVRKGSTLWIVHTFATCVHCGWGRWLAPTPPTTNVPSGWTAWQAWLGTLTADTAAVSRTPGDVQVFGRGPSNGNILTREYSASTSSWNSGWTNLGNCTTLAPSAVAMPNHNLYLFARNCDNYLTYRVWTPSGWGGWVNLGDFMTSAPSAAVWQNGNRMDVFFRGNDHSIYDLIWTSSKGWQTYLTQVGTNQFDSSPAAVSWQGGNRLNVYARGSDGHIYERSMTAGGSWNSWHIISSATLQGDPTVTAWQDGNALMLFSRGQDNSIWSLSYASGKWAPSWQSLDGLCVDNPSATSSHSNALIVFCRDQNNGVAYKYYNAYW